MQTDRTLQFWDTYHTENESKEWISKPSNEFLNILLENLALSKNDDHKKETIIQMLEIGCGTSTMARDLWHLLVQQKATGNHDSSNNNNNNIFRMCATDVSTVCIEVSKKRDAEIISSSNSSDEQSSSSLEYRVLDVLKDEPPETHPTGAGCDVILDKGCVDTFLFRSKNRGKNSGSSNVLREVLNRIWSWMAEDGVFMVISPRSRLKAIRDFSGFASVERKTLTKEFKGELVGMKNEASTPVYVYVCRKNSDYIIGETPTYKVDFGDLPKDDARCPTCDLTFLELRQGKVGEGRGVKFWARQWKGHCIHCKGTA